MDIIGGKSNKRFSLGRSRARQKRREEKFSPLGAGGETLFCWKAKEFPFYKKSKGWFFAGGIIFFLLVGYFTYSKQLITALTFLLLGLTIYLFSFKKPREIDCVITYQSISVDDTIYPFKELISFWTFYEPPDFKVISLKHKKPYLPYIQIPLGNEDPMKIRRVLLKYLPEEEQEEPFSDRLARIIRF
ncbi:MAG: hypothetical protein FJZ04_00445 [Candidatus Moranbacteria bacterium]|nr:hypothetical protein [Candidatus Moranbacteria bacterium]